MTRSRHLLAPRRFWTAEQTFKLPPVPEDDFVDDIPWNTGKPQEEFEL